MTEPRKLSSVLLRYLFMTLRLNKKQNGSSVACLPFPLCCHKPLPVWHAKQNRLSSLQVLRGTTTLVIPIANLTGLVGYFGKPYSYLLLCLPKHCLFHSVAIAAFIPSHNRHVLPQIHNFHLQSLTQYANTLYGKRCKF